jgi:hypothetical protein
MEAGEFDRRFDDGEDVTAELDLSMARRVNQEQTRHGGAARIGKKHEPLSRDVVGALRRCTGRSDG